MPSQNNDIRSNVLIFIVYGFLAWWGLEVLHTIFFEL